MNNAVDFLHVARLPDQGDNVAIATTDLEAGLQINYCEQTLILDHSVMEGHRFAIESILKDQFMLSWGLPFGRALIDIQPGNYICNEGMLSALKGRLIKFKLPNRPNFIDHIEPYLLDEENFSPYRPLSVYKNERTFQGFCREGGRGVGTRNYIVVMGTSSRTAGYARQLSAIMNPIAINHANVDGVVAVAHTEGGNEVAPNNAELLLRTLAGFMVHPNVGAVLVVDYGNEFINNDRLCDYMETNGFPLKFVPHRFMSIEGGFVDFLEKGENQIRAWIPTLSANLRSSEPLRNLRIALQCGGSDAFSGISGNPLVAWVARELIRYGGGANLAETDELIGAESYVLQNVRDLETAKCFLNMIERFKERVAWHGDSAEGNPSGGNKFRGLYNIVLKSIGAAMKRHPDVSLDFCIDYGEQMNQPGFYFMDSPGNDLESIAGQVAAGCNMIFFVTGNGSITNFPFVPTLKVVTTTQRYEKLSQDMDVNAGAYQDGISMKELGSALFDRTLEVAGGDRSLGEKAGHSQIQIWRDWPQISSATLDFLPCSSPNYGFGVKPELLKESPEVSIEMLRCRGRWVTDQIGLVVPTSLCSGQVAKKIAESLNDSGVGFNSGLSRFTSLVHTEGCGVGGIGTEALYTRSLLSYLKHPLVHSALLLEHGCEKTHNDFMRNCIRNAGMNLDDFGWASVQMDGGISASISRAETYFHNLFNDSQVVGRGQVGIEGIHVGFVSAGSISQEVAKMMECLVRWIAGSGGMVVLPQSDKLLYTPEFVDGGLVGIEPRASLAYGEISESAGLHIMENPTQHWTETLTGMAATGVEIIVAHIDDHPQMGHPLVPLLQISASKIVQNSYEEDIDLVLRGESDEWPTQVLNLIVRSASRCYKASASRYGNFDFQFTRGLLGVSM
mgnify:CR=1 FL=1